MYVSVGVFVCVVGEKFEAEAQKQQLQAEVDKARTRNPHNEASLRSEVGHALCLLICASYHWRPRAF
jgi:hypothetical protein